MNDSDRTYKRVEERFFSAHHPLLQIAERSLSKAQAKDPGWMNEALICITFSALSIEAMANAIGSTLIQDWKDFESASPTAKIRLLAEHLGVEFSPTKEPWSTIKWLGRFRNTIAHPKPEHIVRERLIPSHELESRTFDAPESKFERELTSENARRAFEAVYKAKRLLCEKIPYDLNLGLEVDGWSSSTELHPHHK